MDFDGQQWAPCRHRRCKCCPGAPLWSTAGVELAYRTDEGERRLPLVDAWSVPLESALPQPDWSALRHEPQHGCPRCDAQHPGGPVLHVFPHHRYVCVRHRVWIGPPDLLGLPLPDLAALPEVVAAQRAHLRLLHRHGPAATFDAILTAFLIRGHLWARLPRGRDQRPAQLAAAAQPADSTRDRRSGVQHQPGIRSDLPRSGQARRADRLPALAAPRRGHTHPATPLHRRSRPPPQHAELPTAHHQRSTRALDGRRLLVAPEPSRQELQHQGRLRRRHTPQSPVVEPRTPQEGRTVGSPAAAPPARPAAS